MTSYFPAVAVMLDNARLYPREQSSGKIPQRLGITPTVFDRHASLYAFRVSSSTMNTVGLLVEVIELPPVYWGKRPLEVSTCGLRARGPIIAKEFV